MRKVMVAMLVSLDGVIEAPDGDLGWSYPDQELQQHFNDLERAIDTHLYGRRLYETMAAYWPTVDENPSAPQHEVGYARIWKAMPKIVFSKTLDRVAWNSKLGKGSIAEEVKQPMFRLLPDKINLQHVETTTFGSGAVLLRYRRVHEG